MANILYGEFTADKSDALILLNKLRIKGSHNSISEGEFFLFDYRLFTDSLEHYLYKSLLLTHLKQQNTGLQKKTAIATGRIQTSRA
jgi:hypothetical protein